MFINSKNITVLTNLFILKKKEIRNSSKYKKTDNFNLLKINDNKYNIRNETNNKVRISFE